MENLIRFLIEKITGTKDFKIEETEDERGANYLIHANPEIIGLIIGKEGKTIKNIRRIASVRGVLENKSINLTIVQD
jgi:predicted RNA-binding protein YlqC (UPF0109 family)